MLQTARPYGTGMTLTGRWQVLAVTSLLLASTTAVMAGVLLYSYTLPTNPFMCSGHKSSEMDLRTTVPVTNPLTKVRCLSALGVEYVGSLYMYTSGAVRVKIVVQLLELGQTLYFASDPPCTVQLHVYVADRAPTFSL